MNANTVEGAKKTALYFIQLYPYAMATGDLKEFDALSFKGHGDANCGFCSSARKDAVGYVKNHQKYSGGAITATVVETYDRDPLYDAVPFDIRIEQEAITVRAADGTVAQRSSGSGELARVEVIRVTSGWQILTIAEKKG